MEWPQYFKFTKYDDCEEDSQNINTFFLLLAWSDISCIIMLRMPLLRTSGE